MFFRSLGVSCMAFDVLDDESDEEVPLAIPLNPNDESDEEVPLAIPLYPNADGISFVVHYYFCLRVKSALLLLSI